MLGVGTSSAYTPFLSRLLNELQEGHIEIVKMKSLARSCVWWPGIDKALETLVKSCHGCQENRPMPAETLIHHWEWPQRNQHIVHFQNGPK